MCIYYKNQERLIIITSKEGENENHVTHNTIHTTHIYMHKYMQEIVLVVVVESDRVCIKYIYTQQVIEVIICISLHIFPPLSKVKSLSLMNESLHSFYSQLNHTSRCCMVFLLFFFFFR